LGEARPRTPRRDEEEQGRCELFTRCPMRKVCPNLERDDALDTVLEVPIPEEMFSGGGSRGHKFCCTNVKAWMRSHAANRSGEGQPCSMTRGELQLMLGVIGAPLIPLPVHHAKQSPCSVLCEQLKADPIVRSNFFSGLPIDCSR
jgi:hypothetical protein